MQNTNERSISFSALLDYFIPREIQVQPDTHRRARMFMLSHIFGPFLGNVIPLYLYFVAQIPADYRFWGFLASVTAFWLYPFALRYTKMYRTLAFLSIQNLNFCILWACFSYGGIYSPFLPWMLVIPVLSFLYLPATGLTRTIILAQMGTSVGVFAALVVGGYSFPPVNLDQFQIIGLVSIISASIYVIMMAFYFANVFREQGEFEGELNGLVATADNLRNLTEAARLATAAKADFVASMSHELRTPLNAVIGYSQLMLEDAEDSADPEDEDFVADVLKIHSAGTHLLSLVDDILDFSKIEANKMESRPSVEHVSRAIGSAVAMLETRARVRRYSIRCALPQFDPPLHLDWDSLVRSLGHVVSGITAGGAGGQIDMAVHYAGGRDLEIQIVDPVARARDVSFESLFDVFSDTTDASATKYGDVGISLALGQKFAELCGGRVTASPDPAGRRVFTMSFPALAAA